MSEGLERTRAPRGSLRRWGVRLAGAAAVVLLVMGLGASVAAYIIHDRLFEQKQPGAPVEVTIPPGASGDKIAAILSDHGVISHELYLQSLLRIERPSSSIKHGTYRIPRGISARQVLDYLLKGPVAGDDGEQIALAFPEGLTIGQMARRLDDPEAFQEAAADPELIASLGIEAETLEGFLMPDTYFFDPDYTAREVVERMVRQFKEEYEALLEKYPSARERDILEIVTIASLVEEEAAVPEERPLVAGVIYKRMEQGMRLEMDCTLQYVTGKYGERLLYKDKAVDSPYNTYQVTGLPPGPISNPGVASLRAAMQPEGDYLYFVSNADGKTHTFSKTMRDHLRAVAEYRDAIARQRASESSQDG